MVVAVSDDKTTQSEVVDSSDRAESASTLTDKKRTLKAESIKTMSLLSNNEEVSGERNSQGLLVDNLESTKQEDTFRCHIQKSRI